MYYPYFCLGDEVSSPTLLGREWRFAGDDASSHFLFSLRGDGLSPITIDGR